MEIAERMVSDYKRRGGIIQFEILRLPENKEHCAARNAAVRIASGDYFLFVDSDDFIEQGTV
jgi:glycosyltransferase involved in cell wall biosynthesis